MSQIVPQRCSTANVCIGHFIEQVYNLKRPHSVLGYLTPIEFEEKTYLNYH